MSPAQKYLNSLPVIDWSEMETAYFEAERILSALAQDPSTMRMLVENASTDPSLLSMHECHTFDDKIVLADVLDEKGYRIRLRLGKKIELERIHNHRFDTVHHIIRGGYDHTLYTVDLDEVGGIRHGSEQIQAIRKEPAGSSLLLTHDAFHITITPTDTISLILRGPTRKPHAVRMNPETGESAIKLGIDSESETRKSETRMGKVIFDEWIQKLKRMEII